MAKEIHEPMYEKVSQLKTNEEPGYFYAPKICMSWKNLHIDYFGVKVPINSEPGMGKYWIPVFDSEDECKREYPNAEVIKLKK